MRREERERESAVYKDGCLLIQQGIINPQWTREKKPGNNNECSASSSTSSVPHVIPFPFRFPIAPFPPANPAPHVPACLPAKRRAMLQEAMVGYLKKNIRDEENAAPEMLPVTRLHAATRLNRRLSPRAGGPAASSALVTPVQTRKSAGPLGSPCSPSPPPILLPCCASPFLP